MAEQTPEFKQAVTDSRSLKQKPGPNEMLDVTDPCCVTRIGASLILLQLYSLFKQGTQDPTFENATKPGMFDMVVRPASHWINGCLLTSRYRASRSMAPGRRLSTKAPTPKRRKSSTLSL